MASKRLFTGSGEPAFAEGLRRHHQPGGQKAGLLRCRRQRVCEANKIGNFCTEKVLKLTKYWVMFGGHLQGSVLTHEAPVLVPVVSKSIIM
jgi:hypothetical protein